MCVQFDTIYTLSLGGIINMFGFEEITKVDPEVEIGRAHV